MLRADGSLVRNESVDVEKDRYQNNRSIWNLEILRKAQKEKELILRTIMKHKLK